MKVSHLPEGGFHCVNFPYQRSGCGKRKLDTVVAGGGCVHFLSADDARWVRPDVTTTAYDMVQFIMNRYDDSVKLRI